MLKEKDAVVRRVVMVMDAVVVTVSFFIAYFLREHFHYFYKIDLFSYVSVVEKIASVETYIIILFLVVPLWCAMLYFSGAYNSMRTKTSVQITWLVMKAAGLTAVFLSMEMFIFKLTFVSRMFFIMFMVVSTFLLLTKKLIVFYVAQVARKKGYNYRRLIIVGTGSRAANLIRAIKGHPEWGFKIRALLDYEDSLIGKSVEGIQVTGTIDNLQEMLLDKTTDEVIFLVPRSALDKVEKALCVCETLGIRSAVGTDLFKLKLAKLRQAELNSTPFIIFEVTPINNFSLFFKNVFDVVASFFGLILLSPIFLIVAALIKITSRGPIFFLQRRMGLNGRKFVLCKFRTMYKDAHKKRFDMEKYNESDGPVFKIKKDPRITPIGKFLRKYSVDELPQLINVLMGSMSLVGPRPPLPKEVIKYEPWQRRRLSMKPGITCLWQVSGRNKIGFAKWMELDLEYIDRWSLSLDFYILIRTTFVVLQGTGY